MPDLDARPATDADIDEVCTTLALGFASDPVWGDWAFPDARDRVERLTRFWRPFVSSAVRYEGLMIAPGCSAVAMWVPPGVEEIDPENSAIADQTIAEVCGARAPFVADGFEVFESSRPDGSYWYLSLLATHPDHRGKGLGMALVAHQLARVDAQGLAAYLESTNPVNIGRYEAAGFALCGAFDLPEGPRVDTMWRPSSDGSGPAEAADSARASLPLGR